MDKYIELTVKGLMILVKMDDEGVVVDVFDDSKNGNDTEILATTWETYEELKMEVTHK